MSHVTKTGQDRSGPVLASPSFSWDPQDRDWDQDRTAKDWSVVLSFSSPTLVFDQSWTSPGQDSAALSNGLHGNYFCYNMVRVGLLYIQTLRVYPNVEITYMVVSLFVVLYVFVTSCAQYKHEAQFLVVHSWSQHPENPTQTRHGLLPFTTATRFTKP